MAKVLVSIDERLLRRVDRAARAAGESRSGYLSRLAEADAAGRSGPGRTPAARAALRRLDRLFEDAPAGDSTEAVRAARDTR
jgi:hypothetical protein